MGSAISWPTAPSREALGDGNVELIGDRMKELQDLMTTQKD